MPSRGSSATWGSNSTNGACRRSTRRPTSPRVPACFSAAMPPSGRRTSSGPSSTGTRRPFPCTTTCRARRSPNARARASSSAASRWACMSGPTPTSTPCWSGGWCRTCRSRSASRKSTSRWSWVSPRRRRRRKRCGASTATCRRCSRRSCASSATPASMCARSGRGGRAARAPARPADARQPAAVRFCAAPPDRTRHGQG